MESVSTCPVCGDEFYTSDAVDGEYCSEECSENDDDDIDEDASNEYAWIDWLLD